MIRNLRIGILILCAIAVGVAIGCAVHESKRPNVVVILIDTLRADHLSFYGYADDTAPFLSKLAAESIVYDNAWSTSSWTAPATASLFTSMYPFQHGVVTGLMYTKWLQREDPRITINRIAEEIVTMPEILKQAGYVTFGISDNPNICAAEGFEQGFDYFVNYNYLNADTVNAAVMDWAEDIASSSPYFLYLHYMDPHNPYNARDEKAQSMLNETKLISAVACYDSEIRFADAHIETLFNHFAWDENTVVIVLSDHGEEFGERGGFSHGNNLYTESLRIPLFVYYPGGGLEPGRVAHNVSIVDVVPTIRSLLGLDDGETDEGVDLLKVRDGKARLANRAVFAHLWRRRGTVDPKDDLVSEGVMIKEWKYIFTVPRDEKLFNLSLDPLEKHNALAGQRRQADQMRQAYVSFAKNSRKYRSAESSIAVDEETLKKLRSLGYVH